MRAIIQRVFRGAVSSNGEVVGSIGPGLWVLLGVTHKDNAWDADYLLRKVLNTKLWPDEAGKPWMKNVMQMDYEVMVVSQFTLYGTLKGNKPDFHNAMPGDKAAEVYEQFLADARAAYSPEKIQKGAFGQRMEIDVVANGPVTIVLDTEEKFRDDYHYRKAPKKRSSGAKKSGKKNQKKQGGKAKAAATPTPSPTPSDASPAAAAAESSS